MGKKTTTRHKNDNTFRFQGQKEKERKIIINRLGSIRDWLREDDDDEKLSCLYKAMLHWQDLNLYAEFTEILSEIGMEVKSLAQVLHQKERIKNILLPKICSSSAGFLDGIFGLLTAFVSDLRQEFVEYLPATLNGITDLVLSTSNPDIVALAFDCYSRLLMDMKQPIIKEFNSYFKIFQRLLGSKVKDFVVESASKAVSFICSKVSKSNSALFCRRIHRAVENQRDEYGSGVAVLLHQIIGSDLVLRNSLDLGRLIQYVETIEGDASKWENLILTLLKRLVTQKKQTSKDVISLVWEEVQKALVPRIFEKRFSYCAHILQLLFETYNPNSSDGSQVCVKVQSGFAQWLSENRALWENDTALRADMVELVCASLKLKQFETVTKPLLTSLITTLDLEQLRKLDRFFQSQFGDYVTVLTIFGDAFRAKRIAQSSAEPQLSLLHWYSDLILSVGGGISMPENSKHMSKGFTALSTPSYYYKDFPRRIQRMVYDSALTEIIDDGGVKFIEAAASNPEELQSKEEQYLRFIVVLKQLDFRTFPALGASLTSLLQSLIGALESQPASPVFSSMLYLVFDLLTSVGPISSLKEDCIKGFINNTCDSVVFDEMSGDSQFSAWNLKLLDLVLYVLKQQNFEMRKALARSFDIKPSLLLQKLKVNLSSGFKMVRVLTLSVYWELCSLLEPNQKMEDFLRFLGLALENEACELDITKSDHLTNYITMESCIKNISADDEEGELYLSIMGKYILGNMFQNHAKVTEACRDTLLPLLATRLRGEKFWEVIGPKFSAIHNSKTLIRQTFVSSESTLTEFMSKLTTLTFGFQHSEVGAVGGEFKIDVPRYKTNLWMIICNVGLSLPQSVQSEINESLFNLYSQVMPAPPFVGVREDPAAKEILQILVPALDYLSRYAAKNCPAPDRRKEMCLGLLMGPKNMHKSVIVILRKISPTVNDFLTKLEKVGEDNWIKSVHLKPVEGPDAFFRPPDRNMYIEFVFRSLLGLRAETKGHCMDQIVSFLLHCTEPEAFKIIKILFSEEDAWKNASPSLSLLKYLKGNMKTICKIIPEWRYKFPNIVRYLVERICFFVQLLGKEEFGENLVDESKVAKEPIESPKSQELYPIQKRKKAILTASRTAIVNFFDIFQNVEIGESLIDQIFQTFIWTGDIADPTTYSSDSISWFFQLMMVWARNPRYHILFVKCKEQNPRSAVISQLFDAFESKHLKSAPHVHLMEVVTLLGVSAAAATTEAGEDVEMEEELPPLTCGETLKLDAGDENLGEKILYHFRDRLLNVITKTNFFKDRMFLSSKTDYYIDFLRLCTKFSSDPGTNHRLCSTIIDLLPKFRNKPIELVGLFKLVEQLMNASCPSNTITMELSRCLCWVQEKGPREALCNALAESMMNKNQAKLICSLNAYAEKVADTPDFEVRQGAFSKCTSLVQDAKKFKTVFFTVLANNCFFYLSHESDIGIVAASEGLLSALAEKGRSLSAANNSGVSGEVHKFLNVVVARLKFGVRSKSDEIFGLYLKVLSTFSKHCHDLHGALKGTHAIFQNDQRDLLLELQEMQLSARAKATNQFQSLWMVMRAQPSTVVDFVIPILSHYLLDKSKHKVALQNLIQCSLDALKWCVIALPHGAYFKYFESVLEAVPEDEQLLKQYHRLLGVILDAYHYELDEGFVKEISAGGGRGKGEEGMPAVKSTEDVAEEEGGGESLIETVDVTDEASGASVSVALNYDQSKSLFKIVDEKFIPKLRRYLHLEEKASHKLARVENNGDSLIKKIPTTLAYVKLLHKLPACVRKNHMLWVVPTLCSSLNSRLVSVRSNVRSTLVKIVEELGPEIFPDIVKSSKATLTRGYQKHVRNFTLLHILKQLKDSFTEKPWCVPVGEILPLVEDEVFGYMAEDKEVSEILKNTPEAKSQNGLQLLHHCALFITLDKLDLILKCPIERARTSKNLNTIKATKSWMTEIATGLASNRNLPIVDLLSFLWNQLESRNFEKSTSDNVKSLSGKYLSYHEDAFILPSTKKQAPRQGAVGVVAVVSWFVYSCLYNLLKKDVVESNNKTLELLNKFVGHIVAGKNDEILEIRTPTVRSLILLYQFPLKKFLEADFVMKMWRKYFMAVNDAVSNEDINMYYKFLTSFCITFTEHRMDQNDFSLLVKCLNRHLQDSKCTGSALVLLRNILQRSLQSSDLSDLIREVKRRICNDDSVHVQEGCRAAYVVYVKNYLKTREEFMTELYEFFKTVGYRKSLQDLHSVYKMIAALITVVPESWVKDIAATVGMDLLLALMKSCDEESQKLISNLCMKNLFDRMSRDDGLALALELEKTADSSEMSPYQREICLCVGKIIEHRKCWETEAVALKLLQILYNVLAPTTMADLQAKCKSVQPKHREFAIFEAISASRKALQTLFTVANIESKTGKEIQKIIRLVRSDYLSYSHESIQDAAVQLINVHLALILQLISSGASAKMNKSDFMVLLNSRDTLLHTILQYVKNGCLFEEKDMRNNVLAGFSGLSRMVSFQVDPDFHSDLMKSLRSSVNMEVRKNPKEITKREIVFSFCAHYVSDIPENCLEVVQQSLVNLTTRERTDANLQDSPMVEICASIQKKLEQRVGPGVFLQLYEKARSALQAKRDNNRAKKKEQVVLSMDPLSGVSFRKRKRNNQKSGVVKKKKRGH